MLHALVFERAKGKPPIIAYHFSAHPVCYRDALSGPDWPGVVAENCRSAKGVEPLFLQGHIGDVNPGDGTKWIGGVEPTARAVWMGLEAALGAARETAVGRLESIRCPLDLEHDLGLYEKWLAAYRDDPSPWQSSSIPPNATAATASRSVATRVRRRRSASAMPMIS